LAILRVFWTVEEELLNYIIVKDKWDNILAIGRMVKVPVVPWEKMQWNKSSEPRGDVRDFIIIKAESEILEFLSNFFDAFFKSYDLSRWGISTWDPNTIRLLEKSKKFKRLKRSILLGWRLPLSIPNLRLNKQVSLRFAKTKEEIKKAYNVMKKSWNFVIYAKKDMEYIVLATINNTPVGMAYLNKETRNIDFGVHVVPEYRRKYIGTTIVKFVGDFCYKQLNKKWMFVVRLLPKDSLRNSDRVAIRFYVSTNAQVLRFYHCYKYVS